MIEKSSTAIYNNNSPFFNWYVMPEAFSASLVEDYISEFNIKPGQTILDPFSGTGTTILAAKLKGINGVGIEVNPFLSFASRIKTRFNFDLVKLNNDIKLLESKINSLSAEENLNYEHLKPNMPRLDLWISPSVTNKVLMIKEFIKEIENPDHQDLFLLSLSSILREVSNMKLSPHAFGSRSIKSNAPVCELFLLKSKHILRDLSLIQEKTNNFGKVEIFEGDCRVIDTSDSTLLPADLAVTSPPYLNNLDYTMQTRMELFFLDFVKDMLDLRLIRKAMVTSDAKAMYKDVKDHELIADITSIQSIMRSIEEVHKDKNWGWDYSYMTAQYFGGILKMLRNVFLIMKPNSPFVIVTGESSHSGILVPVPDITAELGLLAGFRIEELRTLRTRRSSSHLNVLKECSVILRKP